MALNRRHLATAALGVIAAGGAGWLLLRGGAPVAAAPDMDVVLLDGQKLALASLRGKVALVNFWATSCTTCVAEMPMLAATHQRYAARGYETLAVAMSYDPPAFVSEFATSRKLPFKVALDTTGEAAKRFGDVRMTPTTFLLDKQGQVVKRYLGAPPEAELHTLIEGLLARS